MTDISSNRSHIPDRWRGDSRGSLSQDFALLLNHRRGLDVPVAAERPNRDSPLRILFNAVEPVNGFEVDELIREDESVPQEDNQRGSS